MKRIRICTVGRTAIFLHSSILLAVLAASCTGQWKLLMTSFLSIVLHESAHACVAAVCGNPPEMIELTLLGAVMRLEDETGMSPFQRMCVAAAGPLASWLLCIAAMEGVRLNALTTETGCILFTANLAILLMNMLPAFPLDGGRLAALLLECFISPCRVAVIMKVLGNIIGIALIILNVWMGFALGFLNLSAAVAGCCVLYMTQAASRPRIMTLLIQITERKRRMEKGRIVTVKTYAVPGQIPIARLLYTMPANAVAQYDVYDVGQMKIAGRFNEFDLAEFYLQQPMATCRELLTQIPLKE